MSKDLDDEFDSFFDTSTTSDEKPQKKETKKTPEPFSEEESQSEEIEDPQPEPKPEKKKEEKPNAPMVDDDELDTSPDTDEQKAVIVVYGKKGCGKTYASLTIPGKKSCISFDRKTQRIAMLPQFKEDCVVYNGIKYYDKTNSDQWLESSTKSWKYIGKILDRMEKIDKPEWIVIDGGEIVHVMFEMVMRDKNGLRPFQGISNKNLWKYRRMLISQLLTRCVDIASVGVIWTSYVDRDEIIKDGDFVVVDEVPKWIDAVLYETDTVIRVDRATSKNGQRFFATVESSKWDGIKESPKVDITKDGLKKLMSKDLIISDESD